jgi:hypothetical protein
LTGLGVGAFVADSPGEVPLAVEQDGIRAAAFVGEGVLGGATEGDGEDAEQLGRGE